MIKMNEDIKEMLFKLKRQNTFEDIGYFKTALSNEDVDLLLNYINQLQQENQRLKEKRDLAVQKANEEREKNVDLEIELDKYKEVIEEAREYIKDSCYYPELENYSNMTSEEVKELLQILDKVKENK